MEVDTPDKGGRGPSMFVVGTGRCGTKSIAKLLNVYHEPNKMPTVYLAMAASHGWLNNDQIATVFSLDSEDPWPPAVVDNKQSELIDVTSQMYPEASYLWVTRNPADCIASMVAKRWYIPSDDDYPPGYLVIYGQTTDGYAKRASIVNNAGNRTRGDLVGEFTFKEWHGMSQVERCAWWWDWCNRRIYTQLSRLEEGRWMHMRIEDPSWLEDATGKKLPWENRSSAKPVTGWEDIVADTAGKLGY